MREFIKFMFGGYWNDGDSNAVGGRSTLIFIWLMLSFASFSTAVLALMFLGY
jgi:hypothetical protein